MLSALSLRRCALSSWHVPKCKNENVPPIWKYGRGSNSYLRFKWLVNVSVPLRWGVTVARRGDRRRSSIIHVWCWRHRGASREQPPLTAFHCGSVGCCSFIAASFVSCEVYLRSLRYAVAICLNYYLQCLALLRNSNDSLWSMCEGGKRENICREKW